MVRYYVPEEISKESIYLPRSMLNKSLLLTTAFLAFSLGASTRAATMSSDVVESGILEPATPWDSTSPGEVQTQVSAYFSPIDDATASAEQGEFTTVDNRRKGGAIVWGASALALGTFFGSNSDLPPESLPSVPLEPGPDVAPVPELNSGMLVVVAFAGMAAVGIGRKQLMKNSPVRLRI